MPARFKVTIIAGIRTNCKIMPGTAEISAPVKNICQVKVLPSIPRKSSCAMPYTIRPVTMDTSSER